MQIHLFLNENIFISSYKDLRLFYKNVSRSSNKELLEILENIDSSCCTNRTYFNDLHLLKNEIIKSLMNWTETSKSKIIYETSNKI